MVIRAKPKATGLVDGARGEQLLVFSWRRLGAVKEGGRVKIMPSRDNDEWLFEYNR